MPPKSAQAQWNHGGGHIIPSEEDFARLKSFPRGFVLTAGIQPQTEVDSCEHRCWKGVCSPLSEYVFEYNALDRAALRHQFLLGVRTQQRQGANVPCVILLDEGIGPAEVKEWTEHINLCLADLRAANIHLWFVRGPLPQQLRDRKIKLFRAPSRQVSQRNAAVNAKRATRGLIARGRA